MTFIFSAFVGKKLLFYCFFPYARKKWNTLEGNTHVMKKGHRLEWMYRQTKKNKLIASDASNHYKLDSIKKRKLGKRHEWKLAVFFAPKIWTKYGNEIEWKCRKNSSKTINLYHFASFSMICLAINCRQFPISEKNRYLKRANEREREWT